MTKRTLSVTGASVLALGLAAFAVNPAVAQDTNSGKSTTEQISEVANDVAKQAGDAMGVAAKEGQAFVERVAVSAGEAIKESLTVSDSVEGPNVSANDVIEATVFGSDGEKLAVVNDIILTPDGQVENIVLSFGGFFGIGDKLIAVSPDQITIETAEDRSMAARTDLSKADMENADAFEYATN